MIQKQTWPDNLRVVATLSMVLLHVISPILYKFNTIALPTWQVANLLDSSLRFCVPVFVMLSGALLLGKEYPIREFLKKRVLRVVFPFAFWNAVYIVHGIWRKPAYSLPEFKLIWSKMAHGAAYHFWYVYMIIGLYLFIPVIGKWIRACTEKEIRYFLVIWTFTMVISHPVWFKHKPDINLSYFSGFVGYLVLGYYLSRLKTRAVQWKIRYSVVLVLLGISLTAALTFVYSRQQGSFTSLFYGFLTPNVLLSSIGIFMLVQNFRFQKTNFENIRLLLCRHSFGIYLAHVLILSELNRAKLTCFSFGIVPGIVFTTLACLLLSGLLVLAINRLPYGRYISG